MQECLIRWPLSDFIINIFAWTTRHPAIYSHMTGELIMVLVVL